MGPGYLGFSAVGRGKISHRPEHEHLFSQDLLGHSNDPVVPTLLAAQAYAALGELNYAWFATFHCDLYPNGLKKWQETGATGPHAFTKAE